MKTDTFVKLKFHLQLIKTYFWLFS